MPVILVGTLDTKGRELGFVRDRLRARGLSCLVIDAGSVGPPAIAPDIDREELFRRAGTSLEEVRARGDRGHAVAMAAAGAAANAADLAARGQVEGVFGLGGSAGTTIGTAAMRAVPFGIPKVQVSTLASGQTRPYVGGSDLALFPSVADVAGLNRLTRTILGNAAEALAGMVLARAGDRPEETPPSDRPIITATMFGVTTPCVDRARQALEAAGYEVVVFHATGVGGQAMEGLIRDGQVAGVLDLTTTELADEHVGGILTAGPDRLGAAVRAGVPQVVSLGALDMVNFGPIATVPEVFRNRRLHVHNPTVTLMRTTPEECRAIGLHMGRVLGQATGPTVVLVPRGGVSALDAPGQPFYDPGADAALVAGLHEGLAARPESRVQVLACEEHINDPSFADRAAQLLIELMSRGGSRQPSREGDGSE